MATDAFKVQKAVQHVIRELITDREVQNESIEYPTAKEGMLELHCDWQDLKLAIKRCNVPDEAAIAAVRLAAAAIKFATDLGSADHIEKLYKPEVKKTKNATPAEVRQRLRILRLQEAKKDQ